MGAGDAVTHNLSADIGGEKGEQIDRIAVRKSQAVRETCGEKR